MKGNATPLIAGVLLVLVGLGVTVYAIWQGFGRVTISVHRMYTCTITVTVSKGIIMGTGVKCVPQTNSKHTVEWGVFKPLSVTFYHLPKVMLKIDVLDMHSASPVYTYYTRFRLTVTVYGVPDGTHNAWLRVYVSDQNGRFRETSESTITINAG